MEKQKMKMEITKDEFDRAVPAAREPKGVVFEALKPEIEELMHNISQFMLGEPGTEAVEKGEDDVADELRSLVKRMACVKAFVREMRGLDIVLTATGFGVVSTQDTAPASKQRVDALEGQLRRTEGRLWDRLLACLFKVKGWADTPQRHQLVDSLFCSIEMLEQYAGIANPNLEDWAECVIERARAHMFLREHIGNEYMEELLSQMSSSSLTKENAVIVVMCRKYIGAHIAKNTAMMTEAYFRMINMMERSLDKYPAYANSDAYRLNHFKPYENHADDSAFHFVG